MALLTRPSSSKLYAHLDKHLRGPVVGINMPKSGLSRVYNLVKSMFIFVAKGIEKPKFMKKLPHLQHNQTKRLVEMVAFSDVKIVCSKYNFIFRSIGILSVAESDFPFLYRNGSLVVKSGPLVLFVYRLTARAFIKILTY